MDCFQVEGGHTLGGELQPQGAKNEALQVLAAVLLTPERVTIANLPNIRDINLMIETLQYIGVKVEQQNQNTYSFQADDIDLEVLQTEAFSSQATKLRGSVLIIGPLLSRFQKAYMPSPGGDKIGRRRLDTHFLGFEKLGAQFNYDPEARIYSVDASQLEGTYIHLDEASVTGTANLIMAACMAEGTTKIYHAACEPYIQQLCHMIVRMGGNIEGIGSNLLIIHGVDELGGTNHELLPDMIEVGSFIGLAAMTQSELTIKNVRADQLGLIPDTFKRLGIDFTIRDDDIHIPKQDSYEIETFIDGSILTVADAPWPGFTPDLLSIVLVVATQARGSVLIHQKMFESRLFFVDKLIDMGAQIILCDPHRASVIGIDRKHPLRGIAMSSPDIRAGVALLIAALSAEGTSYIYNVNQIDRGYQHIDERLQNIGAKIARV